jgi:hypothetical protein
MVRKIILVTMVAFFGVPFSAQAKPQLYDFSKAKAVQKATFDNQALSRHTTISLRKDIIAKPGQKLHFLLPEQSVPSTYSSMRMISGDHAAYEIGSKLIRKGTNSGKRLVTVQIRGNDTFTSYGQPMSDIKGFGIRFGQTGPFGRIAGSESFYGAVKIQK